MNEKRNYIKVSKTCPCCGKRILDKVTPTVGVIELKCSNCNKIVTVDLSYRIGVKYRLAASM